MQPILSVIIPLYNREEFVIPLAKHIRESLRPELEFIIVDDCSTDSGFRLLKDLLAGRDNIKFLEYKSNMGAPYARQVGYLHSGGSYIAFLDSDDEFSRTRISKDLLLIDQREPDAVIHRHVYQTVEGYFQRAAPIRGSALTELWRNSWHTSGITYSRSFLRRSLGWTHHMPAEDNVLHAKVKLFAKDVVILNSCGAVCRQGEFQTVKQGRGSAVIRAFDHISKLERACGKVRCSTESTLSVLRKYLFWFRSGGGISDARYLIRFVFRRTIFCRRKFFEVVIYDPSSEPYGSEQSAEHLRSSNTSPLLGFCLGRRWKSTGGRIGAALITFASLLKFRVSTEIDVVVANQVGYASQLLRFFPARRVQPWVRICNPRTIDLVSKFPSKIRPMIYNSPLCAERCQRDGIVIENPIPLSAKPIDRSRDLVVAYFGRLEEEKGILELVDAVIESPNVRLFVFGSGKEKSTIERRMTELQARDTERFTFMGTIKRAKDLMPLIDAVVMPSKLEPWGRVAYEALGAGINLIYTETLGCAEKIRGHPNAISIKECTKEEIQRALSKLSPLGDGPPAQISTSCNFSSNRPEDIAIAIKTSLDLWA